MMIPEDGEHAVQAPALEAELLPRLEVPAGTLTGAEEGL